MIYIHHIVFYWWNALNVRHGDTWLDKEINLCKFKRVSVWVISIQFHYLSLYWSLTAPCVRSCNLQICYLPYEGDCKGYIVCQRTAVGTYVAWKMRCAFGSYWGTGKLWTCERVEDLVRQGFRCDSGEDNKCQIGKLLLSFFPCKNREGFLKPSFNLYINHFCIAFTIIY
jgi:hypothetical protein